MNRLCVASFVLAASLTAISSAQAAGGCGYGWHRGPYGGCRANAGAAPVVVLPAHRPATVVVPASRTVVAVPGAYIYATPGRPCPMGYHLGPQGRRCWPN